ncbi:hypothetical protein ACFLRT_04990, partial [Acidobacteriota bacterium]
FLRVFNAVSVIIDSENSKIKIKAKAESAIYFIKSLATYIRKELIFVSNWDDRLGIGESVVPSLVLRSGAHLVYQMEHQRVIKLNDCTPIRVVKVSQAIIKAKIRGHSKPVYLVQYDDKALQFQLIGGRRKSTENDALSVMIREIDEELTKNHLVFQKDYELKELVPDLKYCELSRTFGAYTEYHFTIYQMFIKRSQIILGPNDRWVTLEEMLSGMDKTGISVALRYGKKLDEILSGGFEGLPLSLDVVQRRPLKKILKERWAIIIQIILGIISAILGTLALI